MRRTIAIGCVVLLAGCSGGGGNDGASAPPPPPPQVSAAGIWDGTFSSQGAVINDVSCLITVANELACILFDPANGDFAGGAQGTLQVGGTSQISGSGRAYAASGYVLGDGTSAVGDFTITGGTVAERSGLSLSISMLGRTGTVTGVFDPIYDRDSSLATVAASYTTFNVFGTPASFSIDSLGHLFSQTQSGCVGDGQVSLIDTRFNGYDVQLTVGNCPGMNGVYNGLAITTDAAGTNDVFLFGVFNSASGIVAAAIK